MLFQIIHDLDPVAFSIGSLAIAWYGLSWSISIILGYQLGSFFFRRDGKDEQTLFNLSAALFFACLFGARLAEMVFYAWPAFSANPAIFLRFRDGGLASHGAVAASLLVMWLFARRHDDLRFAWITDHMAIVGVLAGALIRIGNFINGELYGTPTDLPWAVVFTTSDPGALPRHPTQLYESAWLFICFVLLVWVDHVKRPRAGVVSALFLVMVLGGRVFIEFTKASEPVLLGLSKTQWLSVPFIVGGLVWLLATRSARNT